MLSSALLLAASMVVGQAQASTPKEHLKDLKPLIGSWVYEGPLHDEAPGLGDEGDTMFSSITYRWILDRNAIQIDWLTKINGNKVDAGRSLIGWDETKRSIMEWAVTTDGSTSGPWKKEGEVWTYSFSGIGPDGQRAPSSSTRTSGPTDTRSN